MRHVCRQPHGTACRYNAGCRCAPCRALNSARHRELREGLRGRPDTPHGTDNAYRNYGCRCEPCRLAGSIGNRLTREARAERDGVTLNPWVPRIGVAS